MAEDGYKVTLNVYDLSQGLARQLSTTFLGKAIEGIWHTGVVVYGHEYYFGGGIQHAPAGMTPYGTPVQVVDLGVTHVPKDVFEMYLQEISPRYTEETYSLLTHNCNNFSSEVAQFLVGATVPDYILNLPNEVTNSPMGALLMPMIQQLESTLRANAVPQVPQSRPPIVAPAPQLTPSGGRSSSSSVDQSKNIESHDGEKKNAHMPPAVKSVGEQEKTPANTAVKDPLGDARGKVQEEITREFTAIMATGTLRASEAAALATKKVIQRYGETTAAMN
ncbi:unnamed protein product [Withania somnifera]